jgi:uncharacterized membrane protein YsdA (DUF1294 family)
MPARPRSAPRRLDAPSLVVLAAFALLYTLAALVGRVAPWADLLYAGASALCGALYAVDKGAARAGRDRIPESMLLSLGLVGGWPGALVAQQLVRHKTAKRSFRLRFWITVVANVAVFAWIALRPHLFDRGG